MSKDKKQPNAPISEKDADVLSATSGAEKNSGNGASSGGVGGTGSAGSTGSTSGRAGSANGTAGSANRTAGSSNSTAGSASSAAPALARGLTARSLIIGGIGSVVITASSLFIALKMGALPWPIVFAALVSVAFLRLFKSKDLHEANVCHAAMSAGAMVAGGLAFTLPGLWILGAHTQGLAELPLYQILIAALCGTAVGLVISASLQPLFIRKKRLAYPIGTSAAQTLLATDKTDGKDAKVLFGTMSVSALFALLRDNLGLMPAVWSTGTVAPGVTLGIMNSPMMAAVGFIIGTVPACVWFLGAVLSLVGISIILPACGLIGVDAISGWQTSLGLGLMMGTGAGAVIVNVIPAIVKKAREWESRGVSDLKTRDESLANENKTTSSDKSSLAASTQGPKGACTQTAKDPAAANTKATDVQQAKDPAALRVPFSWGALVMAIVACVICLFLQIPLLASLIIICGAWFCGYISAWLTGTTGVNPMEIFGVLILLLIQLLFHDLTLISLFLGAAIVAVACGMVGDVMNDLKAGDELRTDPRDQYLGMVLGGFIGAVVASIMLFALFKAYGADAFGPQSFFVAAQASVVATMAGGIPVVPVFIAGIIAGFVLALFRLPVMTLGLGVYLPFYMSAAAFVGALIHMLLNWRNRQQRDAEKTLRGKEDFYVAAASGILGGESLIGVMTALFAVIAAWIG